VWPSNMASGMDNKHEFELDNTEQMELILDKRKDPEKPFAP